MDNIFYAVSLNGVSGSGYPKHNGFLVVKGSKFSQEITLSISNGIAELRKKLIESNILVKEENYLVLTQDYLFTSASTASSLLFGRSSNGLKEWKLSNGKTLKEVLGKN
ncbi:DUF4357 domain-containing protein [Neobacillus niacini]|uniref:DUF4357 domain-containing protein n=1 Tax=Neobacillus niacini TaxID=86668 RepID=UPI00068B31CA|nr:DUF4357 domain-containing protein [Neobacillus niacini]MEC1523134.1 DUF4357 domain-containing protein [Neobacillus niacini]